MNVALLIGGICWLGSIVLAMYNRKFSAVGVFLFAFVSGGFIMESKHIDKPTAMDVYEGRTTLKYTVVDGVVTDSVVVWKNLECK